MPQAGNVGNRFNLRIAVKKKCLRRLRNAFCISAMSGTEALVMLYYAFCIN